MYKRCTTEESALRQQQFTQCLLKLMQQTPYHQITVGDICTRMALSRKSFYRYFSSREECLHSLVDHAILDFLMEHIPNRLDEEIPDSLFAYWRRQEKLLGALYDNRMLDLLVERAMLYLEGQQHRLNRKNHEQMVFLLCGLVGMVGDWHRSGYQKSPEEMTDSLRRLLFHGLCE